MRSGQMGEDTLEELLRQGMNRISFGVQSFVDRESAAVGRLHTAAGCEAEIARLRKAGVEEISLDLMVGLPHQTRGSWEGTLERAMETGVPHISVYLLEVDEESRLGKEMLQGGTRYGAGHVPGEDECAEWFQLGCERLAGAGWEQYEISNFARAGHRSRHNLKYWTRAPYVGFGLDAHSMLHRGEGDAVRFANTSDLEEYVGGGARALRMLREAPEMVVVGAEAALEETLFLGLRMAEE